MPIVSSGIALPAPPVPQTVMPSSRAASRSKERLAIPVVISRRSAGRRSSVPRGNGVRSRIATITSEPASARDERVGVGDVLVADLDLEALLHRAPVGHLERDRLVVVEDRDQRHGGESSGAAAAGAVARWLACHRPPIARGALAPRRRRSCCLPQPQPRLPARRRAA